MKKDDMTFKVKFISNNSEPMKVKMNKIDQTMTIGGNFNTNTEDLYYDEIIYYDGGGVEGYGY